MRPRARLEYLAVLMVPLLALLAAGQSAFAAADAEAFDAIIGELERGERVPASVEAGVAVIEDLRPMLPEDDLDRRSRLDALDCTWSFQGRPAEAQAFADERLQAYRDADHAEGIARVLQCQAGLAGQRAEFAEALALIDEALEASVHVDDVLLRAALFQSRGDAHSYNGDFLPGLQDFLQAHAMLEEAGAHGLASNLYFDIGAVYRRLGEFEQARRYLDMAVEAATASGNVGRAILGHIQVGFGHFEQGEGVPAEARFRTAVDLARSTGDEPLTGNALLGLGMALNSQGDYEAALVEIHQAEALHERAGYHFNREMIRLQRGVAHAGLGQHERALAEFAVVEPALRERGQQRYLVMLYPARARSLEATGRLSEALADWRSHEEARRALEQRAQRNRADVLGFQFDVARREVENERLRAAAMLQEERLSALARTRTWQTLSLVLSVILGLVLLAAVVALVRRSRRLQVMAMTDELTGVANRRRVELYLADQLASGRQYGHDSSVISLDIDHFKSVNDTWGHPAGDVVLQRVARICEDNLLRPGDLAGRVGGEEFLLVLPGTDLGAARMVAERLRAAVEATDMSDAIGRRSVTISLGVARAVPGDTVESVESRVDAALYRAKQAGRNRVELAD